MTRTLLTVLGLAGLTAAVDAQTLVRPVYPPSSSSAWGRADLGRYNFNDPLYHGVYPPTAVYPGGYVSSHSYTNPGSTVPTTYITHYRRLPVVAVPVVAVPVVETYYMEVRGGYLPPPVYPYYPGWWR